MALGISFFAGLLTALVYSAFAAILPARGRRSPSNFLLALAAALTALWAISTVLLACGWTDVRLPRIAAVLRDGGWFAVTLAILKLESGPQPLWKRLTATASSLIGLDLAFAVTSASIDTGLGVRLTLPLMQFAVAVMGLILTENLYRNIGKARAWSVKLLLIALAALYAYHIVMRIPEVLGGSTLLAFAVAEPLLYLVALPLFIVTAIRSEALRLRLHSSRRVVFHSATLIFAGILLQGTAAAALYVRHFGGTPAVVLSIVLGFAGLVAAVAALATESVRSQIRTFINENFFSYKYDYRLEWTKFNQALSRYEDRGGPERVLLTLSDLLDSPGGVLFVRRAGWRQFVRLAHSAFGANFGPIQETDPLLASFVDDSVAILELSGKTTSPAILQWHARFPEAWLTVPLRFHEQLIGFCLLHKPRAPKKLDWEDRNLIALISAQLAGYLVHEQTAQALADSQQLAEFNNRVTFALHDLKNTAGQLNLLVQNAEKFGDNLAFRVDMLETIRHAIDNLQGLIAKLRDGKDMTAKPDKVRVNLCEVLARFVQRRSAADIAFRRDTAAVYADLRQPADFECALDHVVANALEASPALGSVKINIETAGDHALVHVRDEGPGMSADFIARELFRPLHTTKNKGLGIGAYQARALMRDLGGDIEVESEPGHGTTVTLVLPACQDAEQRAAS